MIVLYNEHMIIEEYKTFFAEQILDEKIDFNEYLQIFFKLKKEESQNQEKRERSEKKIYCIAPLLD